MKRPARVLSFALALIILLGASAIPASVILDVDDSGAPEADTDGLLVVRYLFGFSGSALTDGAMAPSARRDPAAIEVYLALIRPRLDIDGEGTADALTDGLLIWRYLSGVTGADLVDGAVAPGAPNAIPEAIEPILEDLLTQSFLPPDPADVAPPLDPTVATNVYHATRFYYTGEDPIQTGVTEDTIEPRRAAMVRGKVLDRQGTPLPGVAITVLGHPELGQTLSREDGMFDLAVNGGGPLWIDYRRVGYLPVQRQVQVPWQDHAWAPDVVLVAPDPIITPVDLNAPGMKVARGGVETDVDGTRQATLLVPAGTQAELVLADGSTQPVDRLSLRLTEYTVGPEGPEAMPGDLPPTTAYTYALEISADEAIAKVGGKDVIFSQPVPLYLEDFIGFPVGSAVPTGYYDQTRGQWVASENGRVIKILGFTGGYAEIDADGDDAADDLTELEALGITAAERERLAGLYTPGQALWRVPLPHLSTWDFNFPFGPPPDAEPPEVPEKERWPDKSCKSGGSIIACQTQALGEKVPVSGTSFALHYQSERMPGRRDAYTWDIPLIDGTVPTDLLAVELDILVAGRRFYESFAPQPQLRYRFVWDGRDAQGRILQGAHPITVGIGYAYQGRYYAVPSDLSRAFGRVLGPSGSTGSLSFALMRAAQRVIIWRYATDFIGTWMTPDLGMGGWSMDVHHAYAPVEAVLYKGDGTRRSTQSETISAVAGTGIIGFSGDGGPATQADLSAPFDVAAGPDGSIYIGDYWNGRVRRVNPEGIIETVAGTGVSGFSGDGGWATNADLGGPRDIEVAPDGGFYIAEYFNHRVRYVDANGIISTFAGTGARGYSGDGGPAVDAEFSYPTGIGLAPDGALYIADTANSRIRRVGLDGIVNTVVGTGEIGCSGDGGLAVEAQIALNDVDVAADGSLLFNSVICNRIRRVSTDGVITTVAGNGDRPDPSESECDGRLATDAAIRPTYTVATASDGSFYLLNEGFVCRVGTDGRISRLAGIGEECVVPQELPCGDGGFATQAKVYAEGLDAAPDGALYLAEAQENRVRRIESPLPGFVFSDLPVADEGGDELYRFDKYGRHLSTYSTWTGAELYRFTYDASGRLVEIEDSDGNRTAIERDGDGQPTGIVAPGGQRTALALDAAGYLASITNPAGETIRLEYEDGGLLNAFEDAKGNRSEFGYDELGRLVRDDDAAGGSITLSRSEHATGYTVTKTTALGRVNSYRLEYLPSGAERSVKTDPSGAVMSVLTDIDGTSTLSFPNGSAATMRHAPDPRFGLQVPVLSAFILTTPGGLTRTIAGSREVTPGEPGNPLSLESLQETFEVNGRTYQYLYDAATRQLVATSPEGHQTLSTLDQAGRVTRLEPSPGEGIEPITLSRDARGLVTEVAQGAQSITYTYDAQHRIATRSDGTGVDTGYRRDATGRVVGVDLPTGTSVAYTYDANGNRTQVIPPSGEAHLLDYSVRDLLAEYRAPANPSLMYGYDLDRARVTTTLPGGRLIENRFDSAGRRTATIYPAATLGFQHDACCGRLATLNRTPTSGTAAQDIAYSYDGDLLTGQSWSGVATGSFTYGYDDDFFPTGMSLHSGADSAVIPFGFDADGNRIGYGPFTLSRDGPGGAVDILSDGVMTLGVGYDALARENRRDYAVNGTEIYAFELTRDQAGRIMRKIETTTGDTHTFDYRYDELGRLTEVRRDDTLVESYAYDANGNRVSSPSATYDAQDRLMQLGGTDYDFDLDGFLARRGSDDFSYSARGELLQVSLGSGETVAYAYDGLGRQVGRSDDSGTAEYLYGDPARPFSLTAVRDPAGTLSVLYYDDEGLLVALERGGERYYVAADPVGTPRVVFHAAGAIKHLTYDAFGRLLSDSNPGFALPIGLAGGLSDPATGLVRFGHRDYEPAAGRWTARDPVLFEGGQLNLYAYVANDPVNLRDPSGLWCVGGGLFHGPGAGGQVCCSGGRCSYCYEIGLGFSRSVGFGPGDPQAEEVDITADASLGCGPAGMGAKCSHNWKCGLRCDLSGNLGPAKLDTSGGAEVSPTDTWKSKCGVGAKIAIRDCMSF